MLDGGQYALSDSVNKSGPRVQYINVPHMQALLFLMKNTIIIKTLSSNKITTKSYH